MKSRKDLLSVAVVLAFALALNATAWAQESNAMKQSASKTAAKKQPPAKKATSEVKEEGETKVARKDVPAPVLAAFEKAYPKATIKGFSKEKEKGQTVYEVESVEGKTHRDVSYAADGKLLITEESVEMKDVPAAVQQALNRKYPKAKVDLAEKVTEGTSVGYEFHLTTAAGKKAEVKFDAKGKEEKP